MQTRSRDQIVPTVVPHGATQLRIMSLSEVSGFDKGVRACRVLWLSTNNNSFSRIRNSSVPGVSVTISSRESKRGHHGR